MSAYRAISIGLRFCLTIVTAGRWTSGLKSVKRIWAYESPPVAIPSSDLLDKRYHRR
jgi:hypothetical protein